MSKLSAVREIMTKKNVATLAMESDQIAAARRIVGGANAAEPYLSNMIRALQLMPWENTAADWQRLEAALIVRAYRGARRAVPSIEHCSCGAVLSSVTGDCVRGVHCSAKRLR